MANGDWEGDALGRLQGFLAERGLVRDSITVTPVGDGHSNLTALVTDGEARVVVRRPPPPPLPRGANDVLREARFMTALAGSAVPVPRVLATATADEVVDVPVVVMEFVEGPIVTEHTPAPFDAAPHRRAIGESLVDSLAALHDIDPAAVGLADAGRPEGFTARHLARMGALVDDPAIEQLRARLEARLPTSGRASILHNDYRLGNVVLAPDAPGRVRAVLDWELATLGDPLIDLGYLLASVPRASHSLTATERMSSAMLEPGYPDRQALAARYAEARGTDLTALPWYVAFASFKLAALYEYSRRRGADAYYERAQVDEFVEAAHDAADAIA